MKRHHYKISIDEQLDEDQSKHIEFEVRHHDDIFAIIEKLTRIRISLLIRIQLLLSASNYLQK